MEKGVLRNVARIRALWLALALLAGMVVPLAGWSPPSAVAAEADDVDADAVRYRITLKFVRADNGQPIAGRRALVQKEGAPGLPPIIPLRNTDAQGVAVHAEQPIPRRPNNDVYHSFAIDHGDPCLGVNGGASGLRWNFFVPAGQKVIRSDKEFTIRVPSTCSTVKGTLVNPITGEKLANAKVKIIAGAPPRVFEVQTDANGNFEIPNVPKGSIRMQITAPGFETIDLTTNNGDNGRNFTARLRPVRDVEFTVQPATAGLKVTIPGNPATGNPEISGVTNAQGKVVLKVPVNNQTGKTKIVISGEQIANGKKEILLNIPPGNGKPGQPKFTPPPIPVTVVSNGSIDGTVTDPSGNPISNTEGTVTVVKKGELPPFLAPKDVDAEATACQTALNDLHIRTDAAGKFVIDNLCSGIFDLALSFPGFEAITKTAIRVALGDKVQLPIQVQPAQIDCIVKGVTIDQSGNRLGGVRIEHVSGPTQTAPTESGPDGVFSLIFKLPSANTAHTFFVRLSKEGYQTRDQGLSITCRTHGQETFLNSALPLQQN